MRFYEASVLISAPPEQIWSILMDGSSYSSWDSGVERIDGEIAQGQSIKVFSKIMPGRAFPVTVTELVPPQRMVWSGGMPLGLFKGVRTFSLSVRGVDQTQFTMREEFTGPLVPLIWKSMPDLGPSFQQFAHGLKERAEQTA